MLKKIAGIFGIVLLVIGILGFVPFLTTESADGHRLLLGIFEVDGFHNVVHILTGALALLAAGSAMYAHRFFQAFGVVYAIVFIIGLLQGDTVLGLFPVNAADHVLHAAIAGLALYLGFGYRDEAARTA